MFGVDIENSVLVYTILKHFSLEIKSYSLLFGDNSFNRTANSQFFGMKVCHMSYSIFCNQWNLGHVLIVLSHEESRGLSYDLSYDLLGACCRINEASLRR